MFRLSWSAQWELGWVPPRRCGFYLGIEVVPSITKGHTEVAQLIETQRRKGDTVEEVSVMQWLNLLDNLSRCRCCMFWLRRFAQ